MGILLYAFVGIAITAVVIALCIYKTGEMGLHGITTLRAAFAFGALLSATDPVATMAAFSKLHVDALLNAIVGGEALLNDAVAIVLFNIFNNDAIMNQLTVNTGGDFALTMVYEICK